jgi:outer membrane protein OmpA-like peptidoglycan-associated protein
MAVIFGLGLSVAQAETMTYTDKVYRVADTPNKYGFKGLYMINSPSTYQQGKFGLGVYGEMTRFCLPGDPRYPELLEVSLVGAYGITDKLEVAVAAPFTMLSIPKAPSESRWPEDEALKDIDESGLGNISVGLRYNVIRNENFEVTPYIQAFLPTASDPEKGTGADNTRIHVGATAGLPLGIARLYAQAAYQIATEYDQDEQNFSERGRGVPYHRPRFDYFGTNPLFREYGNTLFYGGAVAVPLNEDDTVELFSEFLFYHSFEDEDYIPLFEDQDTAGDFEPLDVVQDGGMAHLGAKIGFGNGLTLTGGWGAILFAEEPMYESPHWRAFAGLTYNSPTTVETVVDVEGPGKVYEGEVGEPAERIDVPVPEGRIITNCDDIYNAMVFFEFDKATLTPEAIAALDNLARLLRVCGNEVVEVQGHTDWDGTENYNMKLGARRARAVVYYLVYDQGIDPSRVVISEKLNRTPQLIAGETYGESQPIVSNETDNGRAQNRRVQFKKM